MKQFFLISILILASLFSNVKAQYNYIAPPDSNEYDLLYVFDTNYIVNCFLTDDTLHTSWSTEFHDYDLRPYSLMYSKFGWYNKMNQEWCNPDAPLPDGYVIGANVINDSLRYAEAFAQEYTFRQGDIPYNDYVVVGVSIKVGSDLDSTRHICVLNQNFDTLTAAIFHTWNVGIPTGWNEYEMHYWNKGGWNTYYFPHEDYDTLRNLNDFRLAFDVPRFGYNNNVFRVIHTCNVYSPCIRDSINALGGPYEAGLNYDTIFVGIIDRFTDCYD